MSREAISMKRSMNTSTKLHMHGTTSWSCEGRKAEDERVGELIR
jgi:hypothetical protein